MEADPQETPDKLAFVNETRKLQQLNETGDQFPTAPRMESVSAIHEFFGSAEGNVRWQMASPETQFGWQHASRFYRTEQIHRDGPISELPSRPDASIADVQFINANGETETVASHLEAFPVDALIVVLERPGKHRAVSGRIR